MIAGSVGPTPRSVVAPLVMLGQGEYRREYTPRVGGVGRACTERFVVEARPDGTTVKFAVVSKCGNRFRAEEIGANMARNAGREVLVTRMDPSEPGPRVVRFHIGRGATAENGVVREVVEV